MKMLNWLFYGPFWARPCTGRLRKLNGNIFLTLFLCLWVEIATRLSLEQSMWKLVKNLLVLSFDCIVVSKVVFFFLNHPALQICNMEQCTYIFLQERFL